MALSSVQLEIVVNVLPHQMEVVGQNKSKNLLMVKGAVPGANQGLVFIRGAKRLCKPKAKAAAAS